MGYRVAPWMVDALWAAAARAVQDVLAALRRDGTTAAVHDRLLPFGDDLAVVGFPEYEALERRYADRGDPPSS